ncbi:S1 RNA-binding domain-containing protein [Vibrio coralliirubri]|uniref:S1 RNA-binding domain-containing protein n=1 Tax=Vibrio coralliirubri TaxID=1516159 RepID=UPI0022833C6C|nr:S1 RNA-binding domain-containing protein [Vibrio coralliirubri]MCY9861033.1 S1 RNA-binding domain-containing protein [Vibrio coralliirubri]
MDIFEQLLAESMGDFQLKPNEIIEADVIYVDRHKVLIDVGLHTEGTILRSEFIEAPVVGDKIKVVVEALDDGEGQLKIVHREVMVREQSERIPEMVENNEIIDVRVMEVTRAGLNIQAGYLGGFIPRKLFDIAPVTDLEQFVGQIVRAKVLSFDSTHENLVVSRKAAIIDERGGIVPALDRELEIGDIIEGKVINIKRYGVFVDIGGISPLLHISDLNWNSELAKPEDFAIGDRVTVIVKHKDSDANRYFLSVKHTDMQPWEEAKAQLPIGSSHMATVIKVEENGDVRVSVGGVTGLVKCQDVSWTRMTTSSINAEFRRGMSVEVKVVGYDDKFGFEDILVSRKDCVENPWAKIGESFKEGDIIEAAVKSVSDKMLFINVFADVDAIVPVREISWMNAQEAIQRISVGDMVKAVITSIDVQDRRVVASIKQTADNPFNTVKRGAKLRAEVVSIAKNGDVQVKCFAGKTEQIGVVLARNAVPSRSYQSSEIYEIGQKLDCVVINVFTNAIINLNVDTKWANDSTVANNALKDAMMAAKDA